MQYNLIKVKYALSQEYEHEPRSVFDVWYENFFQFSVVLLGPLDFLKPNKVTKTRNAVEILDILTHKGSHWLESPSIQAYWQVSSSGFEVDVVTYKTAQWWA